MSFEDFDPTDAIGVDELAARLRKGPDGKWSEEQRAIYDSLDESTRLAVNGALDELEGDSGQQAIEKEDQAMQEDLAALLEGWEPTNEAWEIDKKVGEIRRALSEEEGYPAWLVDQAIEDFRALNKKGKQQEE